MLSRVLELYLTRSEFYLGLVGQHLKIAGIAIVISIVVGVGIGVLIYMVPKLAPAVTGVINVVYTIPSIALLGFLIPVTGVGNTTAIIALTTYAMMPMVRNTYAGLTTIDPSIQQAAIGMGTTKMQMLFRIELPLAFTVILSGMRNMVVMTVSMCGIASFIGAGGIGVAIYRGITTYDMAMTVSGSILIALLALVLDGLFGILEKTVKKKWRLG